MDHLPRTTQAQWNEAATGYVLLPFPGSSVAAAPDGFFGTVQQRGCQPSLSSRGETK